jgi:pimeloyl-ACP methyl ester carboxylesterase
MSLARTEFPVNKTNVVPLYPEHEAFSSQNWLDQYHEVLEIWDEETEALFAQQAEPVPTVETEYAIEHNGVKGRMFIASPEDSALSHDKHANINVSGYMGFPDVYRKYGHALTAITHAPTAVIDLPLTHGGLRRARDLHPAHIFNPFRLQGQMIGAASKKLRELRPNAPDTHNIIGHSKGGGVATEFAAEKPDHVNTLVLNKSVGVIDHKFLPMLGRLLKAGHTDVIPYVRSLHPTEYAPLAKESIAHTMASPSRLIIEGYRAATTKRLRYDIAKAGRAGVKVTAVWGTRDPFFPPEEEITPEIMELIDKGLLMDCDHVPEQAQPKRAALATAFLLGNLAVRSPLSIIEGGKS